MEESATTQKTIVQTTQRLPTAVSTSRKRVTGDPPGLGPKPTPRVARLRLECCRLVDPNRVDAWLAKPKVPRPRGRPYAPCAFRAWSGVTPYESRVRLRRPLSNSRTTIPRARPDESGARASRSWEKQKSPRSVCPQPHPRAWARANSSLCCLLACFNTGNMSCCPHQSHEITLPVTATIGTLAEEKSCSPRQTSAGSSAW